MYDDKFLPKLSRNLLEILEDNEFYDITIEVVSVNKNKNDGSLTHIKLPNISPEIFQLVLRYIYGGRLSLEEYDTSDIIKILVASSELNLQELMTHLQLFLIKNKKNWMEQNFNLIYRTCYENDSLLKLQNFCAELMFKEPEKIFNSIDFVSLSEKCMIVLIQHDNFQVNTIQVWEQVLKWGVAQNPELSSDPSSYLKDDFNVIKNTLKNLIPFIKFFNLSHKEFLDKVYPYKKILPKDLRDNLIRHFINQLNNNSVPNITKEFDSMTISRQKSLSIEKDFNIMVDEINDFIYKIMNGVLENKLIALKVNVYFNNHNINTQEVYNWLLNNQVSVNSIFLLGYFNFYGIATSKDNEKAINLFINASEKNHALAQYFVGDYYKFVIKNEKLAFEYFEKAATKNYAAAQLAIGTSYRNGIGIEKDFKKAFYWYEKAAKNGDIVAIFNLGCCYIDGIGIEKDDNKTFELYKQAAKGGHSDGIAMLGYCYKNGIGTKIDKQKAFELYQNAVYLESKIAQNNLALMYEQGDGVTKDINKAIYWYNKSANQGNEVAKNNLKALQNNNL
ncbi:kinase-like domain-containing protein [Rhizophagus clarus]|uniref:Kinase-like domain-containing protein n=1 Tax=Rhizophagus clarus TaxID=94130 RepID=A0A8H3R4L6_9GLOM|nr:kinase-like domain-containing protein [Rhizophagus clarus]